MNVLPRTEHADVSALCVQLRDLERRGRYADALSTCKLLVEAGDWRTVWKTGERWLKISLLPNSDCRICHGSGRSLHVDAVGPGVTPEQMNARPGDCFCLGAEGANPKVAAAAASAFAVVGRVAGQTDEGSTLPIPSPLPEYVRALKLWNPTGWYRWLSGRLARPHIPLEFEGRLLLAKDTWVHRDGRVSSFVETCPWLPQVPLVSMDEG